MEAPVLLSAGAVCVPTGNRHSFLHLCLVAGHQANSPIDTGLSAHTQLLIFPPNQLQISKQSAASGRPEWST